MLNIYATIFFLMMITQTVFADKDVLSIDDCIEIAIKNHPSIKANESLVDYNRAKITETVASYLPQIDLSSSYSRNRSDTVGSTGSEYTNSYAAGFSLRQNIYDFGKTFSRINVSNNNLKIAEYNLIQEKLKVILNVNLGYYNYLKAEKLVDLNKNVVEQFRIHLELANGFYRVGTKPRSDVTKSEVEFANAKLNSIKAENEFKVARINLNTAIGINNNETYKIRDVSKFEKTDFDLNNCMAKALNNRPDVLQLKIKEDSYKEQIWIARSDYFPSISGNASYNWRGNEFPLSSNWGLGLSLTLPIFSGFSTVAAVSEAESNLNNIRLTKENTYLNIKFEVEQAHTNFKESEEIYYVTEKIVEQAQENLDLYEGRYKAGLSSIIELTDAQITLTKAKTDKINALYDYKIAEAKLNNAIGELK